MKLYSFMLIAIYALHFSCGLIWQYPASFHGRKDIGWARWLAEAVQNPVKYPQQIHILHWLGDVHIGVVRIRWGLQLLPGQQGSTALTNNLSGRGYTQVVIRFHAYLISATAEMVELARGNGVSGEPAEPSKSVSK